MSLRPTIAIGVAVVCLAATPPLWGQVGECLRRVVVVSVVDEEGNPVKGVTAGDFRGKFRGKPVKIVSVEPASEPPRIVVLLDVSDSMREASRMRLARLAAEDLITGIAGGQRMALLFFSEEVTKEVDFGENRGLLLARLARAEDEGIQGRRRTALLDAILEALVVLESPRPGDVIYVITDGGDSASDAGLRDVELGLVRSGIRLFGFLLVDPLSEQFHGLMWGRPLMSELTKQSGGELLSVWPPGYSRSISLSEEGLAALAEAADRMYGRMLTYYEVEVELAREVDKPRGWKLELVDAQGRRRTHLKVIYPRKLVACATSDQ